MTSRRVSLEVLIDDRDERLCGEKCPYGEAGAYCDLGGKARWWRKLDGVRFVRGRHCTHAEALAAADDAVIEAAEMAFASGVWSGVGAAIDARRKLRATRGAEG